MIGMATHAASRVPGYAITDKLTTSYSFTNNNSWPQWLAMYKLNPIAQGCTLAYALTMPEAPLMVTNAKGVVQKAHGVNAFYDSITTSYRMHIAQTMTNICIGGNSYDVKLRVGGNVDRLQTFSDELMQPVANTDGTTSHFLLRTGYGVGIEIPPEDVIHTRGFWVDPEKPWMGMSPIALASASIETYNEATRMAMSLFKNDGVPRSLLMYQDTLDPDQKALIAESFRKKHGGDNKGSVGVLDGGATLLRLGMSMDDTEAPELSGALESRICGVYRVDPITAMTNAGLSTSHYSNLTTATRNFTTMTRVPMWLLLQDQITAGWQNEYPDVRISFDLTSIDALLPDAGAAQTLALTAYGQGILSSDEAREALGYVPAPKIVTTPAAPVAPTTDTPVVDVAAQAMNGAQIASLLEIVAQVNAGVISIASAKGIASVAFPTISAAQLGSIFGATPSMLSANLSEDVDEIATTDVVHDWTTLTSDSDDATYHGAINNLIDTSVDDLTKSLQTVLARLGKEIEGKPLQSLSRVTHKQDPFDVKRWQKEFDVATLKVREKMVNDLARASVASVDGNWAEIESELDGVQRNAVAVSADKIKESVVTIKDEITELLTANAGATQAELKVLVGDRFTSIYGQSRVNAIARTTATATNGVTQKDVWKKMGERNPKKKVQRTWLATAGARPTHAAASGQPEDANGMFTIGGEKTPYPSGPGLSAKNAVNCNCIARARFV